MNLIFLTFLACTTTTARMASAERNARVHAEKMGWVVQGASCSGSDSDQDGYVSCTVSKKEGDSHAVECGYDEAFAPLGQNTGCKDARPLSIQGLTQ